jgi:hypothetical protein
MGGLEAVANALARPAMDLVGPTVDDDIRRAISRYGAEAVKGAIKRQTAPRVGRPKVNDWKELQPVIKEDAIRWLEGADPFSERSNYAVAKAFADQKPGHSHPATMKRIQRKLGASPYGRKWFTLVTAWMKSEKSFPFAAYVRTVKELCDLDPDGRWQWYLERADGALNDYSAKYGQPASDATFHEIDEGARTPLNALLGLDRQRGGLFGLATPKTGGGLSGLVDRYAGSGDQGE